MTYFAFAFANFSALVIAFHPRDRIQFSQSLNFSSIMSSLPSEMQNNNRLT